MTSNPSTSEFTAAPDDLPELILRPLVEAALREDIRSGDITTTALVPAALTAQATMGFRQPGVLCGAELVRLAFMSLDDAVTVEYLRHDGDAVEAGEAVMRISGSARAILTGERVALNFVQRLSGIATHTRQFVAAVEGTGVRIIDTRKTTPGLRLVEKYAVRCGGGANHRFALDDLILIKDNHVALCGGIAPAVARARTHSGHAVKIEIECDTMDQVEEAAVSGVDIILLDNMSSLEMSRAVEIVAGRALTEASGGIDLFTVRAAAESGVDLISVGALTHSSPSLDVGLDIKLDP